MSHSSNNTVPSDSIVEMSKSKSDPLMVNDDTSIYIGSNVPVVV